ncbi:MAG: L-glutamate gamma-semialdehyde dehydrogenase [Candidatus Marinimicrobia bacterium]|jgi:1-pyrroline-5-carboxylate dehydrogenase|nr:L-glutamate gamma-semialdehyde dehydrogenase [Candidatus Neomarinimicrobiota bacterium]MBT7372795.1 L-glutamate gamma-semialdehyde dehydrogenase [Candidatus Neomarinimicrobiota bacterium]MBT7519116.1 L-glutamate gamma-semialdehyde dehydrogenase [Candidatus Neomarinimicrobiota bacterium]
MTQITRAVNEPILSFAAGSSERASLQAKYDEMATQTIEIPLIIDGKEIKTGDMGNCVMPHNHQHVLATYHKAGETEVIQAIDVAMKSWKTWSTTTLEERTKIFRKAAELLQGPWRDTINAATMLNQSKNAFQAEVDAACELIDFFNFNAQYAEEITANQPLISPEGMHNHLEYRPLEGFVFAITPFNFTSIAGNLPSAPALMGNVALWKPASSAVLPCYYIMKMLEEAGLPAGVINFIPGSGGNVGNPVLSNSNLAGVHFTGSTATFHHIWKTIGNNIDKYKTYPRIVGETGGKDFCLAHESVDLDELSTAMIRGAYEFQGQKCSAMSRAYIPTTIWDDLRNKYLSELETVKVGSPRDFTNFMNAVIDKPAFDSIVSYIDYAKESDNAEIISGGTYDDSKGYFIQPTTILTTDPHFKTMEEEIFGPVLTIYLYDPTDWDSIFDLVDSTSPYALTGCIMGKDKEALDEAKDRLAHSAGNFYINDKPTGAVVGQQPFGGSRASGTNDKAGSELNLLRWLSLRTVKETFDTPKDYRYPFLQED